MTKANDSPDDAAPGWDAITAALARLYPGQEPRHHGTVIKSALGGKDPLDGVSIYRSADDTPIPHWHYVSYGLSELYKKESEHKDISGWGLELTFRLKRRAGGTPPGQPPAWPIDLMQNLARYVYQTGHVFAPGHHINLNGPIALGETTQIAAVFITTDPQLPAPIDTPHGKLQFLQLVGVTLDELAASRGWNVGGMLKLMADHGNPMLVTDLARRSILNDSAIAQAVEAATRSEGSSTGVLYNQTLAWEPPGAGGDSITLRIGASLVGDLKQVLPGRIAHGRNLFLTSGDAVVEFTPGDAVSWNRTEEKLSIALPPAAAGDLASQLRPQRGRYASPLAPGLSVQVVPSPIKDRDGNVVEIIGE